MKIVNKCVECGVEGRLAIVSFENHRSHGDVVLQCGSCGDVERVEIELAPICRVCEYEPAINGGTLCYGCLVNREER